MAKLDIVKELKKLGYTEKDLRGKYGLIADVLKIARIYLTEDERVRRKI